jgi:hypothetical protein
MACSPLAAPRASRGGGHPGQDLVGPEDRLIGPDPRIISRLAKGQLFVWLMNGSHRTRSPKAGDGYPGRYVVSRAGQVDGTGRREDSPWRIQKGRINRSQCAGPDLAPCIGVRLARPVYENTRRTTRERLVGGIATRKGQASGGPGPGHEIESYSAQE